MLVTGGTSMRTFDLVDDKSRFTAEAERAGLACVPAITATNAEDMFAAYETLSASGEVCVKPAVGIYGQGFWRFKEGADPFAALLIPMHGLRISLHTCVLTAKEQRRQRCL